MEIISKKTKVSDETKGFLVFYQEKGETDLFLIDINKLKFYIFVRFLNPVGSSSSAARGQIAANLDESGRVLGPHS